ncbi:MAG: hypothetical protein GAK40_01403 [Burkholderia plantarii]|nr:MAG: hypothetical protein GAK40_01403 [Burkholderia plantarii]
MDVHDGLFRCVEREALAVGAIGQGARLDPHGYRLRGLKPQAGTASRLPNETTGSS